MLVLVIGSITQANKKYDRWWNTDWIISQSIETDQDMLDKGRLFFAENNCGSQDHIVFCNNELFFMGLRLAILDGTAQHDKIRVEYFNDYNLENPEIPTPEVVTFNEYGRHSQLPGGMFAATLHALRSLAHRKQEK